MVLEDIYGSHKANSDPAQEAATRPSSFESSLASPLDRIAAGVADLIVFLPILTLVLAPLSRRAKEYQLLGDDEAWLMTIMASVSAAFFLVLVYQTFFVFLFGATPGKRVLNLRVVSIWGSRPRLIDVFVRSFVFGLELCAFGLPWVAIFSNEKRRPFHDRISDTAVIALNPKRHYGPPTLAEMTIASGVQAAALGLVALLLSALLSEFYASRTSLESITAAREEDGYLCKDVREALEHTPGKSPVSIRDRLHAALTLFETERMESDCLQREAELALWQNQERRTAYLAKAMVEPEGDDAPAYLEKACPKYDGGEICRMVSMIRDERLEMGSDPFAAVEDGEDPRVETFRREIALDDHYSSLTSTSSGFFRARVIKELERAREYEKALSLVDLRTEEPNSGTHFARQRAKLLWKLSRREEARAALRSNLDLMTAYEKLQDANWFCRNETLEYGCSDDGRSICSILQATAEGEELWLKRPEIAVTYIRAEECKGALSEKRLVDLREKLASKEIKIYLDAVSELQSGKSLKAIDLLRSLAQPTGDALGPVAKEALIRLASIATSEAELASAERIWSDLPTSDEDWQSLGHFFLKRYIDLSSHETAVKIGLKLLNDDPHDVIVITLLAHSQKPDHSARWVENLQSLLDSKSQERADGRRPASPEVNQ